MAIESLEELDLEPGRAAGELQPGLLLEPRQNKRQALAYLSQALSLDGGFRHMIDEEHDFDPLRADPDFQAITSITGVIFPSAAFRGLVRRFYVVQAFRLATLPS